MVITSETIYEIVFATQHYLTVSSNIMTAWGDDIILAHFFGVMIKKGKRFILEQSKLDAHDNELLYSLRVCSFIFQLSLSH